MKSPRPETVSWGEFALAAPDLAEFGADRLGAAPAFLATVRATGAPRVHPVTPIITDDGLYVFMEPNSPKGTDLVERGWFAIHNGVADNAGSGGEFSAAGLGWQVGDPGTRSAVADSASYEPADRYVLFELRVVEARCLGYGDVVLPSVRRWTVGQTRA